MKDVIVGGRYRHFKGGEYRVLAVGKHSETLEEYVIYQALYGSGAIWLRPKSMFLDTLDRDGQCVARFSLVSVS